MDEKKKVDKIEKIKKLLKDKRVYKKGYKRDIILEHLYGYVKNLKIVGFWEKEKKEADLYKSELAYPLTGRLREEFGELSQHELFTVTPVNLSYSKTSKFERLFDEFFRDSMQTIFIDLDMKVYSMHSSRSSGSRGSYQTLSEIFEKKKAPTLIPILFKKELLKVYLFPRFIGSIPYPSQWHSLPEEFKKKGYSIFSYVGRRLHSDNIEMFLDPEKKEIKLLKFY